MTQLLDAHAIAASNTYTGETTGLDTTGAVVQVDVTGGPVTVHIDGRADSSAPWTDYVPNAASDLSDDTDLIPVDVGDLNAIRLRIENTSASEATVSVWVGAK